MYYTHRLKYGTWIPFDDVKGYTGSSHDVAFYYIENNLLEGSSYIHLEHRSTGDNMERNTS